MAMRLPGRWTPAELEQFDREQNRAYEGTDYIVDDLMASGLSREAAEQHAGDVGVLKVYLECDSLLTIMADRTASKAVKNAILDGRTDVIDALIVGAKKLKAPAKRGPKAKMQGGEYLYQRILRLKQEGKSHGEIARMLYGSRDKIGLVKVQCRQARQRLARQ
jgi:hypothetical protein